MPRYDPNTENVPPTAGLTLGPRKKPTASDPFLRYGRHIGRSMHAFCNVSSVLRTGLLVRSGASTALSANECIELRVFNDICAHIPFFEEQIIGTSNAGRDIEGIASLMQKGISQARSDDTKGMKAPVLDWIADKEPLTPRIPRNSKATRGFHHPRTGFLLCPTELDWSDSRTKERLASGEITVPGDHWPIFIYNDFKFHPEDPWKGLLRSKLLVTAYKHVFTSPSSVEREAKATRSGNARIHGMTRVTLASIAYIATQVRFALSSSNVFVRGDTVLDSEGFYNSILTLLESPDEKDEVDALLAWWNSRVFPGWDFDPRPLSSGSALSKIRALRAQVNAARRAEQPASC